VARFSTSIPAKKNSTKLFDVTQQEDESTQAYLNRFNEEMLKMKKLLELVALKALIRGVKQHALYKKLYALLDKSLLKVKQVMENHIRVEEVICYDMDLFVCTKTTNMKDLFQTKLFS
jgi:uncharacterized protein YjfI (DUF2170 family)